MDRSCPAPSRPEKEPEPEPLGSEFSAEVLQNENVDYFEEEENVTEKPVDDGIKKTTEKEEKTLEEDDLRNKLNMQRAKREQLIELGLDPPETNKSPEK